MPPRSNFTIPSHTPPVFSQEDESSLSYLEEQGYVFISNVLSKEEQQASLDEFWKDWTSVSPMFDPANKDTWKIENSPMMYAKGMASYSGFSQSNFIWSLRLNKNIQSVFENVYKTKDLVVSFNAFSVFFDPKQKNKAWWHVDQAPSNPSYCVQGAYNFLPVKEDSSGFIVVPRSHNMPLPTNVRKSKRDWIVFDENDPFIKANGVKLVIPENCLVLWNSKTIHANTGMSSSVKTKRLDRITAYISFMPKELRPKEVLEDRLKAYETATACSHWATKCQEKTYPWGFGPRYESRGFGRIEPLLPIPDERLKLI